MSRSRYRSKIDRWLLALLAGSAALAIAACAPALLRGTGQEKAAAAGALLLALALPAWVMGSTSYEITDDVLHVRSGPFHWQVPLREITAIEPTRNPLSSPALSLDRLRIDYSGGRSIMISPEDRERFLAELSARGVATH